MCQDALLRVAFPVLIRWMASITTVCAKPLDSSRDRTPDETRRLEPTEGSDLEAAEIGVNGRCECIHTR